MRNKKIYLSPPFLNGDEIEYIEKTFKSNWIAPVGPNIDLFEKEISSYLNVKNSLALNSGTSALHLALKVLNIKKGDYVFCSDLTFVASANAIKYIGAIPVFIDSDLESWNMCHKSLELALKSIKPKAVIITNIYGQSADFEKIMSICDQKKIPIIEDAAESLGAEYQSKKSGSFGLLSILSFNGNKIITTSGGGMLLSNNEEYIKEAKNLSTQSREDKIYYEHKKVGYNYRLSNVLASIGLSQFKNLDKRVKMKRKIFRNYYKKLNTRFGIEFMPEPDNCYSTRWLTVLKLKNSSLSKNSLNLIELLNENGIESRPVWKPMHLQPLYKDYSFFSINESCSISENLFFNGICLPSGLNLQFEEQEKISSIIIEFFSSIKS